MPATQVEQLAAPARAEKRPAAQAEQLADAAGEAEAAGQAMHPGAPVVLMYVPALQLMQPVDEPTASWYCPLGQFAHFEAPSPL